LKPDSNPADVSKVTNAVGIEKDGNGEAPPGDSAAAASDLSENQALALLQRSDVTAAELTLLGRNPSAIKSRKVLLALATHPRTPRHITIPLLRRLFTFDLMQVALTPTVAADVKRAAEEQLLQRLESLSLGERISLARRASGRLAGALLLDSDARVVSAALDNSHVVEVLVVTAVMKHGAPEPLFVLVSDHPKWSLRTDVQIALLRSENLPLDHALELAGNFSADVLQEIAPESRREMLTQHASPSNPENQESKEQESEEQKAEDQESEDRQSDDQESGDEI
jgi:hypothetical protein